MSTMTRLRLLWLVMHRVAHCALNLLRRNLLRRNLLRGYLL